MEMKSIYFLLTLIPLIFGEIKSDLSIIEGEGFIIHLKVPENFGKILNCWYTVQGDAGRTLIDLNSKEPHNRVTGESITPYTNLICGVRVMNVSLNVSGNWKLEADNIDGKNVIHNTGLKVSKKIEIEKFREIKKPPGKTIISCSEFTLRRSCRISNQRNGIIYDKCEMSDMIRNKTIYRCSFHSWGAMVETQEIITVQVDKSHGKETNGNLTENETHLYMTCKFPGKIENCRAQYPDKIKQIYIRDGFSSENISAFDTDLANGKCVLEIKKPIDDEIIGIWKIFNDEDRSLGGCIFYVENKELDKIKLIQMELDKNVKNQKIEILNTTETDLKFTCSAPFVLDYCYLRDPNNRLHIPSVYSFQRTRMLGQCSFDRNEKIPGEWICGYAGKDYHTEIMETFKVNVLEIGGQPAASNLLRAIGQNIDLLCQSTENEPMTECAFIDPKGNVYLVSNEFNNNKDKSRVRYYGNGLEYGDCGISIKSLKTNEIGDWKCVIRTPVNQYSYKITIAEPKIAQGVANGIGIGFSVIAAVLIMISLFFYRRKHPQNNDETNSNTEAEVEAVNPNPNEIEMSSRL